MLVYLVCTGNTTVLIVPCVCAYMALFHVAVSSCLAAVAGAMVPTIFWCRVVASTDLGASAARVRALAKIGPLSIQYAALGSRVARVAFTHGVLATCRTAGGLACAVACGARRKINM